MGIAMANDSRVTFAAETLTYNNTSAENSTFSVFDSANKTTAAEWLDVRLLKAVVLCVVIVIMIAMSCRFVFRSFSRYVDDGSDRKDEE
ncbi:hypothetical protein DPMN_063409 [Dreissena polymorpha]|uniref:Uncharacterized protein n=1 Tax=Dreissena polymorpha TaxID=45954 RepID=A0A9D4CBH4_DREPO|nr:hypothetical protein DPMN_063409 [Dreissena polymorpha]